MQSLVMCRVVDLAFLKPDFEILAFLTPLAFFENQKNTDKIWLVFTQKGLALAKHCLSCVFIINLF